MAKKQRPFTRKQRARLRRRELQERREEARVRREERLAFYRTLGAFRGCDPARTEELADTYWVNKVLESLGD